MLLGSSTLFLLFLGALSKQDSVFLSSLLAGFQLGNTSLGNGTLTLQSNRGDEALDLGSNDGSTTTFLLGGLDVLNDVLADIVFLAQVEQLADLGSTLGTQATGNRSVSQTGELSFTLLDNDAAQDSQIAADNAATDGLALTFTSATGTIAALTLGEQQTNTLVQQDTLLHRETLLVVTTGDLQDVTLEFFTKAVGFDFLGDALVHEGTQLTFVGNVNELLATSSRVSDVKLFLKLKGNGFKKEKWINKRFHKSK